MNILIRTDIGGHHGMGHAVRMLVLARQLQATGVDVSFVTSTPLLQNYVVPFRCDIGTGLQAVSTPCQPGDILIVDTKADDWANDESALWLARDAGIRVVRIDHPQATPDSCDLLIGPCAHWDAATVTRLQAGFGDRFLYGWESVLLDPQVTRLPPHPYAERSRRPIVFAAGGSDPTGALQRMYDWTAAVPTEAPLVFLVGAKAPMLNPRVGAPRAGRSVVASFDRGWIRSAGYLVTLFGVTCYEALWWQVPQSIFSHTPEHAAAGDRLETVTEGCCVYEGDIADQTAATLDAMLRHAEQCPPTPWEGSSRSWTLDGRGLERVAARIVALAST